MKELDYGRGSLAEVRSATQEVLYSDRYDRDFVKLKFFGDVQAICRNLNVVYSLFETTWWPPDRVTAFDFTVEPRDVPY